MGFGFWALLSGKERKTLRRHPCGVEGWGKKDRDTDSEGSTKLEEKRENIPLVKQCVCSLCTELLGQKLQGAQSGNQY